MGTQNTPPQMGTQNTPQQPPQMGTQNTQTNTSNPQTNTPPKKLYYIDTNKIVKGSTVVQFYPDDKFKNDIKEGIVTGTPIFGLGRYEIDNKDKVENVYTYDPELSDNKRQVQVQVQFGGRRRKSKKVFKNKNKNMKRKSRNSRKSSKRSRRY
jgi:hypothetical protein